MNYKKYLGNYSNSIFKLMDEVNVSSFEKTIEIITEVKKNKKKIFIIGNGGSASIASHVSVDFAKAARIQSSTFNNSNLITCFANDYGYENWVTEAIKAYCSKDDIFIFISSSGTSLNILNAAKYCKLKKFKVITLTGFKKNNPVSKLGNANFHVNSDKYNYIEMTHHIILLSLVDYFINKKF
tara:strand:+ start:432 stop:980 length:549 start_codon:yes stop_codon:yes gene_type:complete